KNFARMDVPARRTGFLCQQRTEGTVMRSSHLWSLTLALAFFCAASAAQQQTTMSAGTSGGLTTITVPASYQQIHRPASAARGRRVGRRGNCHGSRSRGCPGRILVVLEGNGEEALGGSQRSFSDGDCCVSEIRRSIQQSCAGGNPTEGRQGRRRIVPLRHTD